MFQLTTSNYYPQLMQIHHRTNDMRNMKKVCNTHENMVVRQAWKIDHNNNVDNIRTEL